MKLTELPSEIRNAILQSAMRLMSESNDMTGMLAEADKLLKYDFPEPGNTYYTPTVKEAENLVAQAKWIDKFTEVFHEFWIKTGYPKKYWRSTLNGELSSWLCGEWKTTDAESAAKSNISYWEN